MKTKTINNYQEPLFTPATLVSQCTERKHVFIAHTQKKQRVSKVESSHRNNLFVSFQLSFTLWYLVTLMLWCMKRFPILSTLVRELCKYSVVSLIFIDASWVWSFLESLINTFKDYFGLMTEESCHRHAQRFAWGDRSCWLLWRSPTAPWPATLQTIFVPWK